MSPASIEIGDLKLYSVTDLSKALGVTRITLRSYMRDGKIKGQKMGGTWYCTEKALTDYFERREAKEPVQTSDKLLGEAQTPQTKPGRHMEEYLIRIEELQERIDALLEGFGNQTEVLPSDEQRRVLNAVEQGLRHIKELFKDAGIEGVDSD